MDVFDISKVFSRISNQYGSRWHSVEKKTRSFSVLKKKKEKKKKKKEKKIAFRDTVD